MVDVRDWTNDGRRIATSVLRAFMTCRCPQGRSQTFREVCKCSSPVYEGRGAATVANVAPGLPRSQQQNERHRTPVSRHPHTQPAPTHSRTHQFDVVHRLHPAMLAVSGREWILSVVSATCSAAGRVRGSSVDKRSLQAGVPVTNL